MITIVGCGPGASDYLTDRARAAIASADVLVGSARLLALAGTGSETIEVSSDIDAALTEIEHRHTGDNHVAVLVSGDPGIFSLSKRVIARFGRESCTVIPGISSVQAAFAAVGEPWDDALILSAHHELPDLDSVLRHPVRKFAVLSGRDDTLAWLSRLLDRLAGPVDLYACENLTLENERITRLATDDLATGSFSPRCVFLAIGKETD